MSALVVYESMYGNTRAVAQAVTVALRGFMPVEVTEVSTAPELGDLDVDLLVIGAPTHAFGLSRPETRRTAHERVGAAAITEGTGMREWLASAYNLPENLQVAVFDTHVKAPLPGSAHGAAVKRLERLGADLVGRPTSFYVHGYEGPLLDGELDRAHRWGEDIGRLVANHQVA